MGYSDDLIEQAKTLAAADPTRPKQASLRRAVSAAYYALFHETIDRAVASFLSGADATGLVGDRLRRVVDHKAALKAAKWFAGPATSLPPSIQMMRGAPQPAIDPALSGVCRVFIDLQAERHRADYDLSAPFARAETRRRIADAEQAIRDLRTLPARGDSLIFFLGCLFGESLTRNS